MSDPVLELVRSLDTRMSTMEKKQDDMIKVLSNQNLFTMELEYIKREQQIVKEFMDKVSPRLVVGSILKWLLIIMVGAALTKFVYLGVDSWQHGKRQSVSSGTHLSNKPGIPP